MNLADLSDKFPRELKVSYMRLLSFGNKNSISGEISTAFCGDAVSYTHLTLPTIMPV